MYIKEFELTNIKNITHLKMSFPEKAAGWHVILGENGSGKTTLIRALAVALMKEGQASILNQNWNTWLTYNSITNKIKLHITFLKALFFDDDNPFYVTHRIKEELISLYTFDKENNNRILKGNHNIITLERDLLPQKDGGQSTQNFSCSFGPFRRFYGGDIDWIKKYKTSPNFSYHFSAFGEEIALTEILDWLQNLKFKQLAGTDEGVFDKVKKFINQSQLLPHNFQLHEVTPEDVLFKDGNEAIISVIEISDGYRSILSLMFELIRLLIKKYGQAAVFQNIDKGEMNIPCYGIVLIDEIDAHLHPTWQTKIGEWFTTYFPKMQFIVTTHSPLICRGAEKGTIWRLPAPAEKEAFYQVTGTEYNRLVYGNILDAYSTGLFGEDTYRSEHGKEYLEELGRLNIKDLKGQLSKDEAIKLAKLRTIFRSEANLLEEE